MISLINTFLKMFIMSILTLYVYYKVSDIKSEKISTIICNLFNCLIISCLYTWTTTYISSPLIMLLYIFIIGIINSFIVKVKVKNFELAYIVAFCIAYSVYLIAILLTGAITYVLKDVVIGDYIHLSIIAMFSSMCAVLLFKIPRLKNGVNFVKRSKGNKNIILPICCVLIVIFFVYFMSQRERTRDSVILIPAIVILTVLFLFYSTKRLITKHYKNNMRDRTINIQKEEIDANVKVIEELKEQNLKLSTTIHKYNHRLSALENSIRKVMDRSNAEFASELSIVLEQTKRVEAQFAEETKVQVELPSTNVIAIDNMLEYMRNEAFKSNIDFTLKLSDSIIPLLDKHISEDKFETLLADHIKDAIIAIKSKSEGYKSILVLIGIVDGAYELSIYDTGVEFDIPTLLKLGTEPVTTHKDNGGSGLGFMTTFETLKCSRASLVIEEYDSNVTNYTKSVTIRFDGKCEYRIYSYRADDIKKDCGNRSRIKIKKI